MSKCRKSFERVNDSRTRLAASTYLDEDDIGLVFIKTFLLLNKIDDPDARDRVELLHEFCDFDFREFQLSAEEGTGLEALREAIYESLDVVRVYTKMPNQKEPDFDRPYTIRRGGTLLEIAELIHKDFAQNLKNARVWGSHVHDGTSVKGDYVLHDKDLVELHI